MAKLTAEHLPLVPIARSATEEIMLLSRMLRAQLASIETDIEAALVGRGILVRIEQLAEVANGAVNRYDGAPDESTLMQGLGG